MNIKLFIQEIVKYVFGVLIVGGYCLFLQIPLNTGMVGYL